MTRSNWILICLFILIVHPNFAQNQPSSKLYHELLKLKETKRILFVAAHPDDENTRLISYLANGEHAEVAYLSLTRGDGGQNLIGKELGIELGLIRTHELLKARETDGGRQFFSRALDFGYSKDPDETLNNWDKEKLLSDVVWIIRSFQPDIIINRFNSIPGTTHGQHTTSAILSTEAFSKAADKKAFPEQLKNTGIWQAKRIFWNAYNWGGQYEPEEGKVYHQFSVGEYNPLLGATYSKIAADSRTMHKSQGFGSTAQIGSGNDFVELIKGEAFEKNPFENIPNRWEQIGNGKQIESEIQKAMDNFDFTNTENNLPRLIEIKKMMAEEKSDAVWFQEKKELIDKIILGNLGVQSEFTVRKEIAYPGEKITGDLVFNNPSRIPIQVLAFESPLMNMELNQEAKSNQTITKNVEISIPKDYPVSQPFWLENPLDNSLFDIRDQHKIGPAINGYSIKGNLSLSISGQKILLELPLMYKYNDQVDGEIKQPFTLVPEVNVSLDKNDVFLVPGADHSLKVEVSFRNQILAGNLSLKGLNAGDYKIIGEQKDDLRKRIVYDLVFEKSDMEKKTVLISYITEDGRTFNQNMKRILYKHIPNLTYFTTSTVGLVKMDLKISGQKIGYINGAGDDVPGVLKNLGYQVSLIENGDFNQSKLSEFATIIVGIRAFNVNQALADNHSLLMEYVKQGGNLIVQYNTNSPLLTKDLGPYPFSISRDRVAVEDSPVKADFTHPIFSSPNQIKISDFKGWVQERGLYFLTDWDKNYSSPLTLQDPGEDPSQGSLLFTQYGKGTYTYSGISWFRQLPAGVPGAVKIFVNLIEQGSGR
ncbi:hypothetical protein P872_04985 [Rhodonellum psychrophilum GCM71 = DSM 17998]|uniref:LmbE family protein n=2 Tax=Rhodonellum TaxID=336827 RepID=U5C223_9BACT|nr:MULTISPECIES: PIG-L family deacetylase [Rhodonellum]ERM82971.1 hypothetical protein P872_04985 [Rhodonellum psychrophilum GCM71 = DSM 17998]SDZ36422.1 GlcNAc-PI de-N-acetylase [Rhodonellum ikkaensis]